MAASGRDGEISISVDRPPPVSRSRRPGRGMQARENGEERRQSSASAETAANKVIKRKLKSLNSLVLCVALLEWAGNAVGTLATLWATVVLLGGFCSLLSRTDFWFSTVMIFVEATRVFIRNDASVNQWLFGSTRAFRWTDFSFPHMLVRSKHGSLIAVIIGAGISGTPVHLRPEIVAGILKVAILVIVSQLLTRLWGPGTQRVACTVLCLLVAASLCGGIYGLIKLFSSLQDKGGSNLSKKDRIFISLLPICGMMMPLVPLIARRIMRRIPFLTTPLHLLCLKVSTALMLACLPVLQIISAVYYYGFTILFVATVLLTVSTSETTLEQNDSSSIGFLLNVVDTLLPILFFWSVMFPLPGISLRMSFYILGPVLAAVLIGNLQIPVSVLQILLSVLRLRSLLGHHRHDYHPLPEGASHNFVPSIVVFFMLELCQGSSSIFAIFLGVISLPFRRSLVLDLGFTQKLGAKAVSVYFHQAYQVRTEKGLFASEKHRPSLDSFAIKSIGCSSREMQTVGLCILDNCLQRGDSKSNNKLITDIVKDATNIIPKIIGLISYLTDKRQKEELFLSLKLVRRIATDGGRIGARFRQDLSENPFFLNNLECILDLENSQPELWKPVMDIIAAMALDKAARQEIGSSQAIINRLMGAFLSNNNPGGTATGEALANLTILSPDNCWAILLPRQGHNLIKTLINMLEDDNNICVAANILHNLCVNSRDMLINLGAGKDLESALPKVMEIIMTKEGKQMEAALSVASQIHYVIHEYFAQVLLDYSDTDAAALVKKLVDTLNSNKEPCPEYPRMRRVLVEMVISIVDRCPRYISIFIENGVNDTLNMVKGTPSIFDKYRIFLGGKGVVTESLPMHELVDNAKRLIQATPTPGAQPGGHA